MSRFATRLFSAFAVLSLFCVSQLAVADTITVSVFGTDTETQVTRGFEQTFSNADSELVVNPDDTFSLNLPERPANDVWQLNGLTASGDFDPIVNLGFVVTNTSASPADFVFTIALPVSPALPAPTFMGASASFTVTDANFAGGASLTSTSPDPMFLGLIDGAPALPLFDDPSSIVTPAGSLSDFQVLGLPGPTIPSGPVASSIGIEIRFTLSPGDSASGTTSFIVEVPEPSSMLLVFSLIGTTAVVRRSV